MSNTPSTIQSTSNTPALAPQSVPASRGNPKPRRPPSSRDLEIYKRVKLNGLHHWEVAQELGIDRSRVSQVVKRVTRWLAAGGHATDPLIRDHAARQRLAQGDLKLRLNQAIQMASHALQFRFPLETTRRRVQGVTEVWREETKRDVPYVNLTALRLLLDATKSLERLEQSTPTPANQPSPTSDNDLLRAVFDFLCGCRARAQADGRLPLAENIPALIADTLTALVGLPSDHFAASGPVPVQSITHPAHQNAHQPLTVSALPDSSIAATGDPSITSDNPPDKLSPARERSP